MGGVSYGGPLFRQRAVQHGADGPQHVNRANDQGPPAGQDRHEPKCLPGAEEDGDFAREVGKARQAATGESRHHQGPADEGQPAEQAAEAVHLQRAGLLVEVAAQAERQRGEEAVRDHDQHRARHADEIQGGDAEEDKAHVGDAGIADEPVEVLLAHGDPAAIEEVAEAEPGEDRRPVARGVREQRQGDANQAVEAELLEHTGMEHGGGGGSGAVAEGRPGVKGPERDKNPEAKQEQREDEVLRAGRKGLLPDMLGEFGNVERGGARLQVERDESHQRNERAEAEVQRDLEGGVVLPLAAAPDANHDKGRAPAPVRGRSRRRRGRARRRRPGCRRP